MQNAMEMSLLEVKKKGMIQNIIIREKTNLTDTRYRIKKLKKWKYTGMRFEGKEENRRI